MSKMHEADDGVVQVLRCVTVSMDAPMVVRVCVERLGAQRIHRAAIGTVRLNAQEVGHASHYHDLLGGGKRNHGGPKAAYVVLSRVVYK